MSIDVQIERVPWAQAKQRMAWQQGEHVTLIGGTGAGKTELMVDLLSQRKWDVFLNTKRIDATQDRLRKELGFRISRDGIINHRAAPRWIISPRWVRSQLGNTEIAHRAVYQRALTEAFWQTGWTVGIDELEYINRDLKIVDEVNRLLRQGRSQHNTMILGTQRPRHVTLHAYEQAIHLFLWRQADAGNAQRASELAGINSDLVMEIMSLPQAKGGLGKHDALYAHKDTGEMFITNTRWETVA